MNAIAHWLCSRIEVLALRKLASGRFKDDGEREAIRRILATVRNLRGAMELE